MTTLRELLHFLEPYTTEIAVLAGLSLLLFFLALFGLPLLIIAIPPDYFIRPVKRYLHRYKHPILILLLLTAKNILGVVFILIGVLLLFMPGQGLLSIFAGIMLLNFPGKHRLELAILCRPSIRHAIDWIRTRAQKDPLILPECCTQNSHNC